MVKLTKKAPQEPKDGSLQMRIRQFVVYGRKNPSEKNANPDVVAIRIFATNPVAAKSKFWYTLRKQEKVKTVNGQIIAVREVFEKNKQAVKTFGILFKYQSRTNYHNMYKEFRDVTLNGAVSQLFMEMSGSHRANHDTIHVIKTEVVDGKNIRRPRSLQMRNSKIKFPLLKRIIRPSQRRFRTVFKANRPSVFSR
jgi:large subunit ribosomal protein L18Ae